MLSASGFVSNGSRKFFAIDHHLWRAGMTIPKQEVHATLADLAARYPQTFVLEKYQPHRPLKVGIAADLMGRGPELDHHKINVALTVYTRRIMFLRSLVAGAARVDLDGNPAGEVTARDAEYATAKLAKILASREAAAVAAAKSGERVARPPAPAPSPAPLTATSRAPPAKVVTLKRKPVLRLAAFPRPH
jgi:ProP effector